MVTTYGLLCDQAATEPHMRCCGLTPEFLSGHVGRLLLFKYLQNPEPQFLDDMLGWSDGKLNISQK